MKKMMFKAYSQDVPLSEIVRSVIREYVQQRNEPCTSSETLRRSNTDVHIEVNLHRCRQCGKTYNNESDLRRHERAYAGETPFQCGLCNKSFNDRKGLRQHEMIHTGNKPHVCEICGKAFLHKHHLKLHKFIHNDERQFVCPVCGKDYKQVTELYEHMRIKGHKDIVKNKPRQWNKSMHL